MDHLWQSCSTIYHECMALETTPLHPTDVLQVPLLRRACRAGQEIHHSLPAQPERPRPRSGPAPYETTFPAAEDVACCALTTKTSTAIKGAVLSALRAATTDDLFELSAVALVTESSSPEGTASVSSAPKAARPSGSGLRPGRTRLPIFEEVTRRLAPPDTLMGQWH